MSLTGNWSYPTAIKFGAGRIAELPEACAQTGMKRPLLVTDRGLRDLPITTATLDIMETAGLGRAIFADVDPNPNEMNSTRRQFLTASGATLALPWLDSIGGFAHAAGAPIANAFNALRRLSFFMMSSQG